MKILFLECIHGKYNELKYSSCVAHRIAQELKQEGHQVIEVVKPTPEVANMAIKKYRPDIVWWVGHGNQHIATLENVSLWIDAPDYNTGILRGTKACAMACLTGVYLGMYEVKKAGCLAYLGYRDYVYFPWCGKNYDCACTGENPYGVNKDLWLDMVECVPESNLYFVKGLAKGLDPKKAADYSVERFKYWLDYFEKYKATDRVTLALLHLICWIIVHDIKATVIYYIKSGTAPSKPVHQKPSSKVNVKVLAEAFLGFMAILALIGGIHAYENRPAQELRR